MSLSGIVRATCPACGLARDCKLVQHVDVRRDADALARLLAGNLNVLACDCGVRTQLAANLVVTDDDFACRVVPPDGDWDRAAHDFDAAGMAGTRRLVPSQNALVEKLKLRAAGLEDWAIEMTKALLLASLGGHAIDQVLLFERADADAIHWLRFDPEPARVASTRAAYERLAARTAGRPRAVELRIDRAWAIEALRQMIEGAS